MLQALGESKLFPEGQAFRISSNELTEVIVNHLTTQGIFLPQGKYILAVERKVGEFILHLIPSDLPKQESPSRGA